MTDFSIQTVDFKKRISRRISTLEIYQILIYLMLPLLSLQFHEICIINLKNMIHFHFEMKKNYK
jgi:hypothetical protein